MGQVELYISELSDEAESSEFFLSGSSGPTALRRVMICQMCRADNTQEIKPLMRPILLLADLHGIV